jgi:hypothetical protein
MPLQEGFEPLWGMFRCLPTAQVTDPFLRSYRSERFVPKDLLSSIQLPSTYSLKELKDNESFHDIYASKSPHLSCVKFRYFEKATEFEEISHLFLKLLINF